MNGRDYAAFFRPGEGAQAPLLHQAIGTARAGAQLKSNKLRLHAVMETAIGMIEDIAQHPPMNTRRFRGKPDVKEQVQGLKVVLERYKPILVEAGLSDSWKVYEDALEELEQVASYEGRYAPNPTAAFFDRAWSRLA